MATTDMHTTFIDTVLRDLGEDVMRTHVDRWVLGTDDVTVVISYEAAGGGPARVVTGAVVLDERPTPSAFDALVDSLPFGRLRTLDHGAVAVEESLPAEQLTGDLLSHSLSFVTWAAGAIPAWTQDLEVGPADVPPSAMVPSSAATSITEPARRIAEASLPADVVQAAGYL